MRQAFWGAAGLAAVLAGCGAVPASVPSAARPAGPALTLGQQAARQVLEHQLFAQAANVAAAKAAQGAKVVKSLAPPTAQSSSPSQDVTLGQTPPAPSTHPPAPSGIPERDVPVADPLNVDQEAPPLGALVGFVTTIDTDTGIASVGPGWEWEDTATDPSGTFVPVYGGGSVALPATLPTSESGAPGVYSIYAMEGSPTSVTVGLYSQVAPPTPGANGLINGGMLATDVSEASGPGYNVNDPYPTWLTFETTFTGLTWSGGNYGAGTPSITAPAATS